jgi:hypothetical protein
MAHGAGFDPGFRGAVKKDDGKGEPEETEAGRECHEVKEVKETKEAKNVSPGEWVSVRLEEKRRLAAALQRLRVLGRCCMSVCGYRCGAVALDFGEGFSAALANLWIA